MAKANDITKISSLEPDPTNRLPINPPSDDWVTNETLPRHIDLSDGGEVKPPEVSLPKTKKLAVRAHDKTGKHVKTNGVLAAKVAKTEAAKNASDIVKDEINGLYGEMIEHGRTTIQKAIAIGGKLVKIKATLKHGQFGDWIDSSLDFDQKSAERYMKLYNGRERLKIDTMSNITNSLRKLDEETRANRPKAVKAIDQLKPAGGDARSLANPQMLLMDKNQVAATPSLAVVDPDKSESVAPVGAPIGAPELPLLVLSATEETIAAVMGIVKNHGDKCLHQIIREDGQIKLNEYFAKRLALMT